MRACVFPGQGSQAVGMGEGLFERYPEITAAADEILGYSVAELCLEDPQRRLHQTQYTQPALYVVNALTYRSRCDNGAPLPDFVAGHSLGEYNALWAADVFDFEVGLQLVKRRGELMSRASGGSMAAVLGCDAEKVEEILRANGLRSLDIANYNTPTQVVLSGPAEDIVRAESLFTDLGATFTPLNVSAAFHSRSMETWMEPLGEALEGVSLRPPKIPVIANVSARPYESHRVRDLLLRQMREPVQWTESIRYLLGLGVDELEEVGPGGVLTKLIKSIRKRSAPATAPAITAERLGAESFRRDYNVRRACAAGSLPHGIASKELVVRMVKAGYLAFFGSAGLALSAIEENIRSIQRSLAPGQLFGVSLPSRPDDPEAEMAVVELCLRHGVQCIEATGHVSPGPALVRYRLKGNKVIARVSRPEVAEAFLNPPPEHLVAELAAAGLVSAEEAQQARRIPMADDICVEADADGLLGGAAVLLPAILRRRNEICRLRNDGREVRIGSSGGIGTPEAAASAFLLGADFILTGSVLQCTVEAATSDDVKDLLQGMSLQETELAPSSDLFELGSRVQVLKKGFFPARANKLYDLWRHHGSWEEIDAATRTKIERDSFGRSFEKAYEEARELFARETGRAESDPRARMALVFRWYCEHASRLALSGAKEQRGNYQVLCGADLGAFNQWVKGTWMEPWRERHADAVADRIMEGAAEVLNNRLNSLAAPRARPA